IREGLRMGQVQLLNRHRVTELVTTGRSVTGVRGEVLSPDDAPRGQGSTRTVLGQFEFSAEAVVVATGGIGGNHDLVRKFWPSRLGDAPEHMITGVPEYVDGSGIELAQASGARWANQDRM
ncbi:FAD-binding dehydrogenase, partial [Escherichia coli]|nr:FAD-binding dehydrogenase [Escherichia coli]